MAEPTKQQLAAIAQAIHDSLGESCWTQHAVFTRLQRAILKGKDELLDKGILTGRTAYAIRKISLNVFYHTSTWSDNPVEQAGQCEDIHMFFRVINNMPGLSALAEEWKEKWEYWSDPELGWRRRGWPPQRGFWLADSSNAQSAAP